MVVNPYPPGGSSWFTPTGGITLQPPYTLNGVPSYALRGNPSSELGQYGDPGYGYNASGTSDSGSSALTQYLEELANEDARRFDADHNLKKQQLDQQYQIAQQSARNDAERNAIDREYRQAQVQLQREQLQFDRERFGQEFQQKAEQFAAQLGLSRDQFEEGRRQFDANMAQRGYEFGATMGQRESEFGRTFGEGQRQFNANLGQRQYEFDTNAGLQRAQLGYNLVDTQARLAQNPEDYWYASELAHGISQQPETATFLSALRNNTSLPGYGAQAGLAPVGSLQSVEQRLGYQPGTPVAAPAAQEQPPEPQRPTYVDPAAQQPRAPLDSNSPEYRKIQELMAAGQITAEQGAQQWQALLDQEKAGGGQGGAREPIVTAGGSTGYAEGGYIPEPQFHATGTGAYLRGAGNGGGAAGNYAYGGYWEAGPSGRQYTGGPNAGGGSFVQPYRPMYAPAQGAARPAASAGYQGTMQMSPEQQAAWQRRQNNLNAIKGIVQRGAHKLAPGALENMDPLDYKLFESGIGPAGGNTQSFLSRYRQSRIGNQYGNARAA